MINRPDARLRHKTAPLATSRASGNDPRRRTRLPEAAPNPKPLAGLMVGAQRLRSCLSQRKTSGMHATGPGSAKSRGARISSAWLA